MSKKSLTLAVSVIVLLSMLLTACGGAADPTAAPAAEAPATEAPAAVVAPTEAPAAASPATGDATKIRWYIGLGAGGNPEEIEKENAFVDAFNAKYGDKYQLVTDIVQSDTANDVLKTQIASGDCPDIVGPVGVRGMAGFEGAWLDMTPYIEAVNYDVSDFNPALIEFYNFEGQGQIGLPFAVYPSALYYNTDLFDEAGLDYPPHEWGAPYADGDAWTFDKMKELAQFLTVDANGNDATSPDFDPDAVEQFGYHPMWSDIRGAWTFFGAGSFADSEGNAQIPEVWREAAKWYYDGMWTDHFIPNDSYVNSDLLGQGNTFGSGAVAMNPNHTWYTCCTEGANWDVAAIPSYQDHLTAKLHADTFGILQCSKNPQAAFDVLTLMLGEYAPDLVQTYGAFPARESLQETSLAAMQEAFPNADLQVFVDALSYPDNPNHESGMPNFLKASDVYATFGAKYGSTAGLDIDAELDALKVELQKTFDEVK